MNTEMSRIAITIGFWSALMASLLALTVLFRTLGADRDREARRQRGGSID